MKTGLVGAAVMVNLQILGIIPCVACCTWPLAYVAYGCIGALAAYWMPPPRQPGPAAGHGALASAIAGAIVGVVGPIIALGMSAVCIPLGMPGYDLGGGGIDPPALWETFGGLVAYVTCATGCYALGVSFAAGLGALGGLFFAAIHPE